MNNFEAKIGLFAVISFMYFNIIIFNVKVQFCNQTYVLN